MAPYIVAENDNISSQDAIKESIRIMDGHKMDLFILELSFLGWMILTVLSCGIVGIYVYPYYQATITNFYNSIKDKHVETVIL